MKFMKTLVILLILIPCVLEAKEPKEVLSDCESVVSELRNEKRQEALLIYNWLANTSETRMHQLRGATGNQLFIHENGRFEAVFDEDGKIVDDDINNGSLNYAHPQKDPVNHFVLDILPWISWGYSAKDPTSVDERIAGLSEALGGGLVAAQENHDEFVKKKLSKDDLKGIAVIHKVLEAGRISEEVFKILRDPEYTPEEPFKIGEGLTRGLMSVLK